MTIIVITCSNLIEEIKSHGWQLALDANNRDSEIAKVLKMTLDQARNDSNGLDEDIF